MDAPESSHIRNAGRVNPRVQAGGSRDSALVVQGVTVQGRSRQVQPGHVSQVGAEEAVGCNWCVNRPGLLGALQHCGLFL